MVTIPDDSSHVSLSISARESPQVYLKLSR
jgi:hypothetical protein